MDFLFLKELEIKPTTFYHHTLKYHKFKMKNQARKSLSKQFRFKMKMKICKVHSDI